MLSKLPFKDEVQVNFMDLYYRIGCAILEPKLKHLKQYVITFLSSAQPLLCIVKYTT